MLYPSLQGTEQSRVAGSQAPTQTGENNLEQAIFHSATSALHYPNCTHSVRDEMTMIGDERDQRFHDVMNH